MLRATLLFLLVAVCAISASPAADGAVRLKRTIDHLRKMLVSSHFRFPSIQDQDARLKRRAPWHWHEDHDDRDDQDDDCMERCARKAESDGSMLIVLQSMDGNFTRGLNDTCLMVARPWLECFDQCPYSQPKVEIAILTEPARYVCVDRLDDILEQMPCMEKMAPDAIPQCVSSCKRYESGLDALPELLSNLSEYQEGSLEELIEIVSGTCLYIDCYAGCFLAKVKSNCGNIAAELLAAVLRETFAALQYFETMVTGGQFLPESCRRLAQGRIGGNRGTKKGH